MKLKTPKAKVYAYRTFRVVVLVIALFLIGRCFFTKSLTTFTEFLFAAGVLLTTSFVSSRKFAKEIDLIVLFSKRTGDGYNDFPTTVSAFIRLRKRFYCDLFRLGMAKLKAEDKCDVYRMKRDYGPAARAADTDLFNADQSFSEYWGMIKRIYSVPITHPKRRISWAKPEDFLYHVRAEMRRLQDQSDRVKCRIYA